MEKKQLAIVLAIVLVCFLFFGLSEQVKANLSDSEIGSELLRAMSLKDIHKKEAALEKMLKTATQYQQFVILTYLAKTEIRVGDYPKAMAYATELLKLSKKYKDDWNYGNAIHDANIVMGMVAIKENHIDEAEAFLLKAGGAPSSPQLKTFGPNMMLAEALLKKGRTAVVIKYLTMIKKVWENNDGRLDSWIAAIKGGGKPYFGVNLEIGS